MSVQNYQGGRKVCHFWVRGLEPPAGARHEETVVDGEGGLYEILKQKKL